jgi:hypothetical protein
LGNWAFHHKHDEGFVKIFIDGSASPNHQKIFCDADANLNKADRPL